MSSSPVGPAPVSTTVSSWVTLIKAHEKLLLAIGAGVLLWHFYGAGLNAWVNHDKKNQDIAQQTLNSQVQTNQQLASTNAALIDQIKAANAALVVKQTKQDAQTKVQQTTDQTLPVPALVSHWEALLNLQPSDIVPATTGLTVSDAASRATVEQLDAVPGLKSDLAGAEQTIANNQKVIDTENTMNTDLGKQIDDATTLCKAELATEKAKSRRSWLRGFKVGAIAGFVGGLFVGHKI